MRAYIYIYTYSDILDLLTCWGSSSSYVYGALNNLQLPGTISDEAHGVLDDLQDRGLGGLRAEKEKINPSRCVIGFNGSACPCYPFLSKTTSLTTLAPGFGGKPCDVLRAIEICPGILDQITGIWCGTVCWRNSMNVEALQIAIWGQETLIFSNWLEHMTRPP